MKGFIEIKEDSYEDAIEHLQRIKLLSCKLIKMLAQNSEIYDEDSYSDSESVYESRGRRRYRDLDRGRYNY